ncbi:hypothetical protein SADUNF_Sadunf15G0002000 [Salix dunnii]|uniref:Uncharacterized protein n=1 Tax=Salix dunnii TaxID=1413687 RepID=A0A835JD87_9ROSI|nr:hypothetical protein SADUNF_Sadunf15G0002000 [Salix dunnii]
MSVSRKTKNSHYFSTPQSLSDWLKPRLPSDSFASWGIKPGTKNIHNLWLEISQGETFLADSTPPIRTVNVVTVKIINKNQTLIESHQELSDGSVRNRCRPLSEKMKPNESFKDAIFRAINEELGSILKDVNEVSINIVNGSYKEKVEERNSMSYPGLPARYVLCSADVEVNGLPDGEFCTEETEEYPDSEEKRIAEKAVSVKKHFWKWDLIVSFGFGPIGVWKYVDGLEEFSKNKEYDVWCRPRVIWTSCCGKVTKMATTYSRKACRESVERGEKRRGNYSMCLINTVCSAPLGTANSISGISILFSTFISIKTQFPNMSMAEIQRKESEFLQRFQKSNGHRDPGIVARIMLSCEY